MSMRNTAQGTSRRALLAGTASLMALAAAPGGLASAASLGAISRRTMLRTVIGAIAGPVELPESFAAAAIRDFAKAFGREAADAFATHFLTHGPRSVLDRQPSEELEDQVRWLALYLYTGTSDPKDADARLTNYPFALSWKSLEFAKAPGLCSGPEFGYWQHAWRPA